MIKFITASHKKEVLNNNLLRSPIVAKYSLHELMGFKNIPEAYNSVPKDPACQLYIYVHHDVYLPPSFEVNLLKALSLLPDDWGVLGVAGCLLDNGKKVNKGYISDRGKYWGQDFDQPVQVQTLDEMLLITRGDYTFDEKLPFDFYGADICMQAHQREKKVFAISAFCEHNSSRVVGGRTPEFFTAQEVFRQKWIEDLPIVTTCALLEE